MKIFKFILASMVFLLVLSACSSQKPKLPKEKLYIWDNYVQSSLELSANFTKKQKETHLKLLLKIIKQSEAKNMRVAPGIYAGTAQVYYDLGDKTLAKSYFLKEKQAYPEASVFIDNVLATLYQDKGERK